MNRECLNCKCLGKCSATNTEKVRNRWYCIDWDLCPPEEVIARVKAIQNLGEAAVTALVTIKKREEG